MKCSRCKQVKPATEFYSEKQGYCKDCAKEYKRDTYNGAKRHRQDIKGKYNISDDRYDKLFSGNCMICGGIDETRLHVDHDHSCCSARKSSCGECVRGVLCSNRNTGLGKFHDDPKLLALAIDYLLREVI